MPATEEFNVLTHFLEQWDWVIDAYRSYLNANFPRSTTLTLCAVTFLTMAEMMRLRYARHLPLQVGLNRGVGYSLFKFLSAIPIFGVSAIRLIEIFTLSRSIGLTVCVAVISMMPAEVPHTARSLFRRARSWVTISEREEVDGVDPTLLPEQTDLREDHFTSTQARHLSILDTMHAVVHRNVVLVLILESVGKTASVAVTAVATFLEWIVRALHLRLRGRREGDDINLEDMPVLAFLLSSSPVFEHQLEHAISARVRIDRFAVWMVCIGLWWSSLSSFFWSGSFGLLNSALYILTSSLAFQLSCFHCTRLDFKRCKPSEVDAVCWLFSNRSGAAQGPEARVTATLGKTTALLKFYKPQLASIDCGMSRYPEADEAQRGHYNDGYSPYPSHAPNPYDQQTQYDPYGAQNQYHQTEPNHPSDPFYTPTSSTLTPLHDPYQPQHDAYSHGVYPPHSQPAQASTDYFGTQHNPFDGGGAPSRSRSQPSFRAADENDADGEFPLLQRENPYRPVPMPGGYAEVASMDDQPESNIRYGRIPQRVPRRYKTLKKVELFHGNLVLDSAVPSKLLDMSAVRTEREFTHMRYSAATCDPNDFKDSGFTLRQVHYDPPRRTELFIVMTMYNESEDLFCRSMHGVIRNVAHLCKRDRSKTWGKDGWKKVVVCIVSDGRQKINSRTLSVIATMGAYQDGIAKNVVNGKPVTAHIYEYTTQVSVTPSMKIEGAEKGVVPVQIIFCLKEKNQKKINSHRWFFNAFGPILQPNVCVLLDVGTMPGPTSIYHLWKAFDINSNVGGACGEIVALKGKYGQYLINPLVAAQNFEYKMSNILDKPLESVFGYITVLPGAFSAYRYIALQNDTMGEGPLQKYFLGEKMHGAGADIFTANMYLAEDRILCWELVSKRGGSWILHYVKSAYAVTDVPDQVPELISQRRRWLNGSFFAAIHSIVHFHYIYRSSHTFMRKFWIHVEMFYQVYNLIFAWFSLGNYYIAFIILSNALESYVPSLHILNLVLNYFYLGLLIMCFLLSLGNRPQGSKWGYTLAFIGFGIVTIYMTFSALYIAVKGIQEVIADKGSININDLFSNAIFINIVLSLAATLGLYIAASLIFFEPWHMITSFVQYLLMAPSYIAVLNVYAFANVHDVSWGTKGDNKVSTDLGVVSVGKNKNEVEVSVPTAETDINAAYEDAILVLSTKPPKEEQKVDPATKQEDYYKTFRTNVLLVWTLSNGLLAAVVVAATPAPNSGQVSKSVNGYMSFILYSVAGLAFVRFLGSTTYMLVRLFAGE